MSQPVPLGLSPPQVLRLLDAAWSPRAAGVLVSEFDPGRGRNDQGLAAVWLVEYLRRRYEGQGAGAGASSGGRGP